MDAGGIPDRSVQSSHSCLHLAALWTRTNKSVPKGSKVTSGASQPRGAGGKFLDKKVGLGVF